ncbi:MAG: hypothetical protein ACRD1T_06960, partial [Acidimicrobiia bacterium]
IDERDAAVAALREAGMEAQIAGTRVEVNTSPEKASDITRFLAAKGLYLNELRAPERSLEEVFFELTQEEADATD